LTHDPPLGSELVERRYYCLALDAQGTGQRSRARQLIAGTQATALNVGGHGAGDLLKQRHVPPFEREVNLPSSHEYLVLQRAGTGLVNFSLLDLFDYAGRARIFLMTSDYPAIVNGFDHSERYARTFLGPQFDSTAIPNPTRVHPRVNRVLMSIPERLENSSDVSLKTLAAISSLSPSRFMHIFTESLGIPLRQYILGLRLQRAFSELMAGATVTSAACSAGFSDASHLTRTFRRILGITPTDLFFAQAFTFHRSSDSKNSRARSGYSAMRRQIYLRNVT
jgi:AraC-like DNA-binding protein